MIPHPRGLQDPARPPLAVLGEQTGLAGAFSGFPPHRSGEGAASPATWQVLWLSDGLASSGVCWLTLAWMSRWGDLCVGWVEVEVLKEMLSCGLALRLEAGVPSSALVARTAGAGHGSSSLWESRARDKLGSVLRWS